MTRRPNPRILKSARSYTVEEASQKLGVAVVTVRSWEKQGLRVLKSQRPYLMIGQDIREFLENRADKRQQPLSPDQFLCMTCKLPRQPLGLMADFISDSPATGRLVALCPVCDREIHRFVGKSKLHEFQPFLDIAFRDGGQD